MCILQIFDKNVTSSPELLAIKIDYSIDNRFSFTKWYVFLLQYYYSMEIIIHEYDMYLFVR